MTKKFETICVFLFTCILSLYKVYVISVCIDLRYYCINNLLYRRRKRKVSLIAIKYKSNPVVSYMSPYCIRYYSSFPNTLIAILEYFQCGFNMLEHNKEDPFIIYLGEVGHVLRLSESPSWG